MSNRDTCPTQDTDIASMSTACAGFENCSFVTLVKVTVNVIDEWEATVGARMVVLLFVFCGSDESARAAIRASIHKLCALERRRSGAPTIKCQARLFVIAYAQVKGLREGRVGAGLDTDSQSGGCRLVCKVQGARCKVQDQGCSGVPSELAIVGVDDTVFL